MSHYELLGILGGTFDPVHNGHLAIVQHLIKVLPLKQVQLIPCRNPPHKLQLFADPSHRLHMLQLAIKDQPKLVINEIELNRAGPSYMVDTLKQLNLEWPNHALCLIIGIDVLAQLNEWHQWRGILQLAHLIVVNRPYYELSQDAWLQDVLHNHQVKEIIQLTEHKSGKIFFQNISPQKTSATKIRRLLHEGENVSAEIPESVIRYIDQHHLYKL